MATTMTTPIAIAYPKTESELEIRIEAGACRLHLAPAKLADDTWITGRYQDPSGSIRVDATVEGNRALIRVGRSPADFFGFISGVPELWLEIGNARPFALTIAAGASENQIDLGGLPVTRLEINHGAGAMDVTFSVPLPVATSRMKFAVGAGKTNVSRLGNVRFDELSVEGGAASCLLDFSGSGLQSGWVRLSTAMASIELRIPPPAGRGDDRDAPGPAACRPGLRPPGQHLAERRGALREAHPAAGSQHDGDGTPGTEHHQLSRRTMVPNQFGGVIPRSGPMDLNRQPDPGEDVSEPWG